MVNLMIKERVVTPQRKSQLLWDGAFEMKETQNGMVKRKFRNLKTGEPFTLTFFTYTKEVLVEGLSGYKAFKAKDGTLTYNLFDFYEIPKEMRTLTKALEVTERYYLER